MGSTGEYEERQRFLREKFRFRLQMRALLATTSPARP
jgi:hypothetical protein